MTRSKSVTLLVLAFALLLVFLPGKAFADLEKVKRACVVVESNYTDDTGEPYVSYGSGFIVDPNGWIVTNAHVIMSNAINIRLTVDGFEHNIGATLYYLDDTIDIAVLKVGIGGLEALTLGDDSKLALGQKLYAMGSPLVFTNILTDGIFSAYNEEMGMIQHTAELYHGNSGGPLVTEDGEVVGVNTMFIEFPGEGKFYFAIPAHLVKGVLNSVYAVADPKAIKVDEAERLALFSEETYDDSETYDTGEFTGTPVSPDYVTDLLNNYPDSFLTWTTPYDFTADLPDFYIYDEMTMDDYVNYGYAGYFYYPESGDPYWVSVPEFWLTFGEPDVESFSEFKKFITDVYKELGYEYAEEAKYEDFTGFPVDYEVDILSMIGSTGTDAEDLAVFLIFLNNPDWDRWVSVEAVYYPDVPDEEFDGITFNLMSTFIEHLVLQ